MDALLVLNGEVALMSRSDFFCCGISESGMNISTLACSGLAAAPAAEF
jgi:hypothetical protein